MQDIILTCFTVLPSINILQLLAQTVPTLCTGTTCFSINMSSNVLMALPTSKPLERTQLDSITLLNFSSIN